jgi:hypothetical protein
MKKKGMLFLFFLGLFAYKFEPNKDLARVEQIEGIYVFVYAKPSGNYKFIDKINMPEFVMNGKAYEMIRTAVRRCKKQHPTANGVIFTNDNLSKAEAILIE